MSQASESLLHRLAGPSVTKAGLAKDQSAINAVIAEVSKGSKFYENEKRKDQAVTERVNKILKERDELLLHANVARIEHNVDKMIAELEATRDLSRTIVHFDMDSFFAAVECLRDPSLKDKPFVVGGSVVSTASYAARKFGVRSGMATFVAKKLCPELLCLHSTFDAYSAASKQVMGILKEYDPDMCMAGCDEGYLDITPYCERNAIGAWDCVSKMRQEVFDATQLTVSAGIAPNMMLAKICSDKNKPNGQYHLPFESEAIIAFMKDLPIRKVPGVGRVQERLLDSIGIRTCGDIYVHRATAQLLDKQFHLDFLLHAYLGLGSTVVRPGAREERKSVGVERTFDPMGDEKTLIGKLEEIAKTLEADLEYGGWAGKTVTLKYKLDTFQSFTRAKSLMRYVSTQQDIFAIGKELLMAEMPVKLRLLGLRLTNLKDLKVADTTGIKRFFAPGPSSPRKRQKLSHDDPPQELEDDLAEPATGEIDNDNDETFFSAATQQLRASSLEPSASQPSRPSSPTKPTKPASAGPPRSVPIFSPIPRPNDKPKKRPKPQIEAVTAERHVCPVCATSLECDNDGLNTHVDYCLSRHAIKELAGTAETVEEVEVKVTVHLPQAKRRAKDLPPSRTQVGQRTLESAFVKKRR